MPAVAQHTASRENEGHWYVVQFSNNPAPTSAPANQFLATDFVDYLKNAIRKTRNLSRRQRGDPRDPAGSAVWDLSADSLWGTRDEPRSGFRKGD
jgi:hypothetical protein